MTLKFSPQVDDGRVPTVERAGQSEFTFAYRGGEMAAVVRAASEWDARLKLERVINGNDDPDVIVCADPSYTHPGFWELEGADG